MMGDDNELWLVCKARLPLGLSHVDVGTLFVVKFEN